ncbi:ABC transporter permease [Paenarthrobacter sp. NyZ202]|uniref:ABC transporter permease n=1 Tax=Paenarthrobacter sp. NyZ202 TaxID=3402689 RepID=UPI003CECA328
MNTNLAAKEDRSSFLAYALGTSAGRIFLVFALVVIVLGISSPSFLTLENIVNLTRQMVFISIIAFAASFVIGLGGIDLSVGANVALTGLVMGDLILYGVNIYLAIVIGLVLGAFYGLVNGLLINRLGIAPFIATLATMIIGRGIIQVYSGGIPKTGLQYEEFVFWGQGLILGVPVPVIVMVLAFIAFYYLMYRTKFGRFSLSIGSNREAARLVGIPVPRIEITVYVLTGLAAAVSSLLLTSRLEAAMPEAATNYELDVIAAVVIGGTSLIGGRVSLLGTLIGAALMAVVRNGINLLNVNTFWQQVVIGSIILVAIAYDGIAARRARQKQAPKTQSTPVHRELVAK